MVYIYCSSLSICCTAHAVVLSLLLNWRTQRSFQRDNYKRISAHIASENSQHRQLPHLSPVAFDFFQASTNKRTQHIAPARLGAKSGERNACRGIRRDGRTVYSRPNASPRTKPRMAGELREAMESLLGQSRPQQSDHTSQQ